MNHPHLTRILAAILLTAFAAPASAADTTNDAESAARIIDKLSPSILKVEYFLRYDEGDTPSGRGWMERCPNCGGFHGASRLEPFVTQERPMETFGVLVGETEVVTPHMMIHPRFIERIRVRQGDRVAEADIAAYMIDQKAVLLALPAPLPEAKPLSFGVANAAETPDKLLAISWQRTLGEWTATVQRFDGPVSIGPNGEGFRTVPANVVVVTEKGGPVAVVMDEQLPLDDSWKTSPLDWARISAGEMDDLLAEQERRINLSVLRASLHFRSPRDLDGSDPYRLGISSRRARDGSDTEQSAAALLVESDRIMILADLPQEVTARLDRIRIYPAEGEPVTADFEATLSDYGILLARLKEPMPDPLHISDRSIKDLRGRLLIATEFEVSGDQSVVRHEPIRIADVRMRHRGRLFPELSGNYETTFLFEPNGGWVAAPVPLRDKNPEDGRWRSQETLLLPAAELATVLSDIDSHIDPSNIPRSEEDENRVAWIGVELQAMDPALARQHRVSNQTNDGRTGALVTHVFSGSPAEEAGIEPGDILLRVYPPDNDRPHPVRLEESRHYYDSFPWEHLDEVPEEYYEYLPAPWTPAVNSFNRMLTRFGYGNTVDVVLARNGEQQRKSFEVVLGPPHYEATPELRADSIGATLRELTFETRRFYRREGDDGSGLILSRIEPGTPASIAGLKPYELITHANGSPVNTVDDMNAALEAGGEVRVTVQRMHQGRIAIIRPRNGE